MPKPLRWKAALLAALALAATIGSAHLAAAQVNASVRISSPITDAFPTVSFSLSVADGAGERVAGLPASSIQIVEDNRTHSPTSIEEVEVGIRQLFVVNTSEAMALRDTRGRSRYQFVQTALFDWWSAPSASRYGIDDLTLIDGDGAVVEHSPSAASLAAALDVRQPTFTPNESGLRLLLNALTALEGNSTADNTPAYVVFFTPLIRDPQELVLTNTIERARQLDAAIFPVLIDTPEASEEEAFQSLVQLAESTQGQVYQLDTSNLDLSELRQRLIGQRTQYQVSYESTISQSGSHQLQVRVSSGGVIAQSEGKTFNLSVAAPDVTFIQPPVGIERASEDPTVPIESLPPTDQPIELLVTFPDGHPRPLTSSQLLVDGKVVAERNQEPFNQFTWDLRGLRQDQQVELQGVVVDSLGIEGQTRVHPVEVSVVAPPGGLAALRPALGPLALVLGVLLVGVVAAIAFLSYGQRRRSSPEASARAASAARHLERPRLRPTPDGQPEARLIPLTPDGEPLPWIPLTGADISLGSDASVAAYPLDDSSVSGLHARLIRQAGGRYLLRDQDSVAGTWVNYAQVSPAGQRLEHGDLIQLGRVTLRFELSDPARPPAVRVVPLADMDPVDRPKEESA
ncbi:MAG: FHA domain-containing protein [Anaerolineales bacterium]